MTEQAPGQKRKVRRNRKLPASSEDPYLARHKPPEPALCPACGLVFRKGRWQRAERPESPNEHKCPACRRIEEGYPAGCVKLSGEFLGTHHDEIRRLIHSEEMREAGDHPLQRIMDIAEEDGTTTVTTTDIHLARRIGEAVHRAYEGRLNVDYRADEFFVRVDWTR